MHCRPVALALAVLIPALCGCGDEPPTGHASPTTAAGPYDARPAAPGEGLRDSLTACAGCHERAVAEYLGHAMAASLGPLDASPAGERVHPRSGTRYAFEPRGEDVVFTATTAAGGRREQLVVGRLGAGVFDVSWVGTEIDPLGRLTGRLAFLPVEHVTGHGPALSPFELASPPAGLDMPVTSECLSCHTNDDPARLPGAAVGPDGSQTWPGSLLGANAFDRLSALGCATCHGDVQRHAELAAAGADFADLDGAEDPEAVLGLVRLEDLSAAAQRDVCARCHLQGDAQLMAPTWPEPGPVDGDHPALRPTLVPAVPDDDFRFVGQHERLVLSACFQGSPDMTCTTCHRPHASVEAQGTASFDARCLDCHAGDDTHCNRPTDLTVRTVTGGAARTSDGCVDCHVRRSQPFDLPHLRTADHWIRRRPPPPETLPMRFFADPAGALAVYDDGRLAERLAQPGGQRWVDGLAAMGLSKQQRIQAAAELLTDFAPPGTPAAIVGSAPPGLPSLEERADFHHVRGLILEATGDDDGALAAYGDALIVDDTHPEARLNRGRLRLQAGDIEGALADAAWLVERYPAAEKPWNLRARAAAGAGDIASAAQALAASTERWSSDPATWHELGRLLLQLGRPEDAATAVGLARRLQPDRPGLSADLAAATSD